MREVLDITGEETIQIFHRGKEAKVLVTETYFLDLMMKAKAYESIMSERETNEKVIDPEDDSSTSESISKLADEDNIEEADLSEFID